jgi:hypothetical protein
MDESRWNRKGKVDKIIKGLIQIPTWQKSGKLSN